MMKRMCLGTLLAASVLGATGPSASARDGWSPGAAAAVGVLGGLAVGSAIANNSYYPGKPVAVAPRPVYVAPAYEPECFFERRRYVDAYGDVIIRRVRVCE